MNYRSYPLFRFGQAKLGAVMASCWIVENADAAVARSNDDLVQFRVPHRADGVSVRYVDIVDLLESVTVEKYHFATGLSFLERCAGENESVVGAESAIRSRRRGVLLFHTLPSC